MLYPSFQLVNGRGILPLVRLPSNYESLVSRFYEEGGKREFEKYAAELEDMVKETMDFTLSIKLK